MLYSIKYWYSLELFYVWVDAQPKDADGYYTDEEYPKSNLK